MKPSLLSRGKIGEPLHPTSSTKALVSDCFIISTILCVSHEFSLSWCGNRPRERRQSIA